jgi:GxxExxY protein
MNADNSETTGFVNEENKLDEITERIIGCAFKVINSLGSGFLEKVYENALAHEIRKAGIPVEQQKPLEVWYDGVVVGVYIADLWVENAVPVELKAVKGIDDIHVAQALNQLKASRMKVGLILNFGTPKLGVRRVVNNF